MEARVCFSYSHDQIERSRLACVTRKGPLIGLLTGREPNRALSMHRQRAAPVVQVQRMLGGRRT